MSVEKDRVDITGDIQTEIKKNEIMEALREVYDPELGMNMVELGLIRHIELGEEDCRLTMILTTPFCPYAPQLFKEVQQTAEIAAGVPTTVEMGNEMWDPSMTEEGAADDWGLW